MRYAGFSAHFTRIRVVSIKHFLLVPFEEYEKRISALGRHFQQRGNLLDNVHLLSADFILVQQTIVLPRGVSTPYRNRFAFGLGWFLRRTAEQMNQKCVMQSGANRDIEVAYITVSEPIRRTFEKQHRPFQPLAG